MEPRRKLEPNFASSFRTSGPVKASSTSRTLKSRHAQVRRTDNPLVPCSSILRGPLASLPASRTSFCQHPSGVARDSQGKGELHLPHGASLCANCLFCPWPFQHSSTVQGLAALVALAFPRTAAMAANLCLVGASMPLKCPTCDARLLNGSCLDHGIPPETSQGLKRSAPPTSGKDRALGGRGASGE